MYDKIRSGFDRFMKFINSLTGAALLIIMCVVLIQVFCRFVIFHSLPWTEEVSRYMMVFMVLLGLCVAVNENMLIKIDAIDSLIHSKRVLNVAELIRTLAGLVCAVIITVSSTKLFQIGLIQKSPAMQIPMIIMYIVVFVSYLLASVSLVFKILDYARALKNPEGGKEVEAQ